jgi:hypothetical protein
MLNKYSTKWLHTIITVKYSSWSKYQNFKWTLFVFLESSLSLNIIDTIIINWFGNIVLQMGSRIL